MNLIFHLPAPWELLEPSSWERTAPVFPSIWQTGDSKVTKNPGEKVTRDQGGRRSQGRSAPWAFCSFTLTVSHERQKGIFLFFPAPASNWGQHPRAKVPNTTPQRGESQSELPRQSKKFQICFPSYYYSNIQLKSSCWASLAFRDLKT